MQCWCSSSAQTFLAGFKKFAERVAIRLVGADLDRIDVVGSKHAQQLGLMPLAPFRKRRATR